MDYSVELCGGTHVGNTSEIGLFKIVKEEGIGSGTRRILAVTGKEAFEAYREQEDALKAVAATLKAPQLKEVPHKVEGLQEQLRQLQKENAELKEKQQQRQQAMSSRMFKKQTATVTLPAKFLYQMQVPFVPLRITGNKKITLTSLFLSQQSVTKSMSL